MPGFRQKTKISDSLAAVNAARTRMVAHKKIKTAYLMRAAAQGGYPRTVIFTKPYR